MHTPEDNRETIDHLRRASLEIALGFERMVKADRFEQIAALHEASAALAEMRHHCEQTIVKLERLSNVAL